MGRVPKATAGKAMNSLIARRLAQLRKRQKLSFDALAIRSRLSKGMLVAIEQGSANPSIGTLCKLATSLRVSLTDLLAEEANPSCAVQIVPADQATQLWNGPQGGLATLLVGIPGPDMLELWEWTIFPGEEFQSAGHPSGTVELLSVTEGTLELAIDGTSHLIEAAGRAVAKTDRPHVYRCHGRKRTRFSMVVREPG